MDYTNKKYLVRKGQYSITRKLLKKKSSSIEKIGDLERFLFSCGTQATLTSKQEVGITKTLVLTLQYKKLPDYLKSATKTLLPMRKY